MTAELVDMPEKIEQRLHLDVIYADLGSIIRFGTAFEIKLAGGKSNDNRNIKFSGLS
jgi:hypothetical protein